jgi:uncharacterized protein (TIGR02145 family)
LDLYSYFWSNFLNSIMKKIFLATLIVMFLGCSKENPPATSSALTDLDGNSYTAITIGKQTWYKENLSVSKYSDGTIIPEVSDPTEWSTLTTGAWCHYENDSSTGEIFGKLYNWYAVAGIFDAASLTDISLRKKLAPQGCHIPADSEWTALSNNLGSDAGGKMKSIGDELWESPNTGAANSSLFTGLPSGICIFNGSYHFIGYHGYWWSSTSVDSKTAWNRSLNYNSNILCKSYDNLKYGLSVRFIKD